MTTRTSDGHAHVQSKKASQREKNKIQKLHRSKWQFLTESLPFCSGTPWSQASELLKEPALSLRASNKIRASQESNIEMPPTG